MRPHAQLVSSLLGVGVTKFMFSATWERGYVRTAEVMRKLGVDGCVHGCVTDLFESMGNNCVVSVSVH